MKKLIALVAVSACSSADWQMPPGFGGAEPSPIPSPSPVATLAPPTSKAELVQLIANSSCAKVSWGNDKKPAGCDNCYTSLRGRNAVGGTVAVGLTYARSVCDLAKPSVAAVTGSDLGSTSKDQFAYMKPVYDQAGIPVTKGGVDSLRAVYVAMFPFAAMESSGKYCEGKDEAADNESSEAAEAGMFQTSWNSRSTHPELLKLFADYRAGRKSCFLEESKAGVKCKAQDAVNYGKGDGLEYQKLNKSCPAFATEWAAIMFRHGRSHYYPLNQAGKPERYLQKWIELRPECGELLKQIESKISPALCEELK